MLDVTVTAVHVNVPAELTVAPHVDDESVAPVAIDSAIVTPGLNPVPDTTAETPVGPWLGVSVIVGVVIVKPAEATSDDTVEWSDPVAVIV